MGILDNFERGLERAVNGAFAKTFRSGLQPVELTSAIRKEMDTKAAVVARDRVLAPNRFILTMSPTDYTRMSSMGAALTDELIAFAQKHATSQHYAFAGGLSIDLREDPDITVGMLEIDSENVKGDVAWTPVLDIDGRHYPLTGGRTVVGRGQDADITVDDTGISRRHVLITWDGHRAQVEDLGSTNGSQLNGQPVKKAILEPDSVVTIGRTRIVFRVLPQATRAPGSAQGDNFWSAS
ncbi:FhaA domain-containing protein [Streptomyces sp. L7]|uniref:FhaA domain-containing protein n=1 Tax=Streptomyces sp. L7 TaxID=3423954 RepID=UPI003D959273